MYALPPLLSLQYLLLGIAGHERVVEDGPTVSSGGVPADIDFRQRFQRAVPYLGT